MSEKCGEVCPTDETLRCEKPTHTFGEHYGLAWDAIRCEKTVKVWPGTPKPPGGDKPSPKRNKDIAEKVGAVAPAPTVGPPTPPFTTPLAGANDPANSHIAAARFEPERGTREREVLDYLRNRLGQWVNGLELSTAEVGGAQGLKRFRDLRLHGWDVENRPDPESRTTWQYRLRSLNVVAPEEDPA